MIDADRKFAAGDIVDFEAYRSTILRGVRYRSDEIIRVILSRDWDCAEGWGDPHGVWAICSESLAPVGDCSNHPYWYGQGYSSVLLNRIAASVELKRKMVGVGFGRRGIDQSTGATIWPK